MRWGSVIPFSERRRYASEDRGCRRDQARDRLAIIGGLFVVEALSVIIQVGYYKRTKKRVFLMAPIHHHFEKKGWAEPQIVIRFWIVELILAIIGLRHPRSCVDCRRALHVIIEVPTKHRSA